MAVFSYTGTVCVFLFIFGRSREISVTKCKRISPFYGGEVTYTNDTEGRSNAFYSCEDAYSLFPSDIDSSNCTKHLKWKPKPPKCLRKAEVEIPDHGKVCKGKSDIILHSESYAVCCDKGYELYNDRYLEKTRARIKNNNGSLEPNIPECVEARCDPSDQYMANIQNLNRSNIMTKFSSRTKVLLSCKDGYDYYKGDRKMTTPLIRTCVKGSIKAPKCKEAMCLFSGYPSNKDTYQRVYLADARLIFDDQFLEPRQQIEVFCHKKKQYELYVNSTEKYLEEFISECRYGKFEHKKVEFPTCVERRCSFSVSSEVCFWTDDREHCIANNFTIPSRSSVHMRCRDGYKLSRSEDGRSVEVDEDALIMCNKGAYAESYRCISEPCAVPTVKHAKLISKEASSYEHGENITFLCNNGFHFNESSLNEEDRFETTCQLGKWINIIPSECQPDLCSLSLYTGISFWANSRLLTEENGLIQTFENGTKLQIECKDGYAMKDIKSGQRVASRRMYETCSLGNWTHQYSCYSEQCSVPKVNNAHLLHTDARIYEHSKKISFVCDTGFHFYQNISTKVNAFVTTCSLGQWTDNIPSECKPDGCKLALLEGTKYFSADKTVEISKATLMEHTTPIRMQCREMFDLFDENNTIFLDKDYMPAVTCYQGKWTNQHFCKKRCGTFNITNGKLIKDGRNVTEGETIAHGESEYVKYNNKKADSDLPADSSIECHDGKWHNFVGVSSSSSTPAKTTEIITTVAIVSTTISKADKRRSKDVLPDKNQIQNTRNKGCTLPDDPRYTYKDSDDKSKDPSSFISDGTTLTVGCTTPDLYEFNTNYDYDDDNNSTSTVTCMNNTLSDFDLDCPEVTPNTCKELQHGSVNEKNGYFIVTCDEGYSLDLIVPERPQCTCENGQLKSVFGGQAPACIPDKCVVPYEFDVRLSVTDRRRVSLSGGSVVEVGDFVYFNCSKAGESKYEPLNRRFKCVNGLWEEAERDRNWKLGYNGEFPSCRAAICEPNCTNGGVCFKDDNCRCKHLTEGKRCEKFVCDDTCFENGGKCIGPGRCSCPAERFGLNCEQKGCILPNHAANYGGQRIVSPGTTLSNFACDSGYVLSSQNGMTCLDGGSWSQIVTCIKGCTLPNHAANHKDRRAIFRPEETLNNFYCEYGYVLSSKQGMTCLRGGSWSEIVTCIQGCTLPNNAANYKDRRTTFSPGVTVNNFYCGHGYVLSSKQGMTCQRGGYWSKIVTCIRGCTLPNHAANHKDRGTTFSPEETLRNFTCGHGYVLSSKNVMTCRRGGVWTEVVTCNKLCTLPKNTAKYGSQRTVFQPGEVLNNFVCDHDYILSSQNGMTCQDDGSWSDVVRCIKVQPKECVRTFGAGHKWYPKWGEIQRQHQYNSRGKMSEKDCKENCLKQKKITLQSVYYTIGHRTCHCLAVSADSYFLQKSGNWNSRLYIYSCK